jgi:hypothetical protein
MPTREDNSGRGKKDDDNEDKKDKRGKDDD